MKRTLRFLLALVTVICLLPAQALQIWAAEVTEGDGTTPEAPVFINSEVEWVYYLNKSDGFASKHETQKTWYFQLTADIELDAAEGEDQVDGTVGYSASGRTIVIDMNGFTVTANGGDARFLEAASATSDLTVKNGTLLMNRTTDQTGSIFYVYKGGKLTLENMQITDQSASTHNKNGELIYSDGYTRDVSSQVTLTNTTLGGQLKSAYPVYIDQTILTVSGGEIAAKVKINGTSSVALSGSAKLTNLDVSGGALVDPTGLTEGADICIAAGKQAFTPSIDNAKSYSSYLTPSDSRKKIVVSDGALILKDKQSMFEKVTLQLWKGFQKSLSLFGLTLLFALPLGLLICFGSMNKWTPFGFLKGTKAGFLVHFKPIRWFSRLLVWIVRGSPLMLQLIIIFYGPPLLTNAKFNFDRDTAALIAFSLNYACYFSEIYRGGIESISVGQYEAGQVLGMSKGQVFFRVVLLQVIKRIMAPMSNEAITLVKDTSLINVINMQELIWAGKSFMKTDGLLWPLFYTGVFYLVFNGLLTILFARIEKKLSYFRG